MLHVHGAADACRRAVMAGAASETTRHDVMGSSRPCAVLVVGGAQMQSVIARGVCDCGAVRHIWDGGMLLARYCFDECARSNKQRVLHEPVH